MYLPPWKINNNVHHLVVNGSQQLKRYFQSMRAQGQPCPVSIQSRSHLFRSVGILGSCSSRTTTSQPPTKIWNSETSRLLVHVINQRFSTWSTSGREALEWDASTCNNAWSENARSEWMKNLPIKKIMLPFPHDVRNVVKEKESIRQHSANRVIPT